MKFLHYLGILAIATILSVGCRNASNKTDSAEKVVKDEQHEMEAKELTLNNGLKWKADSFTNANVNNLRQIVASGNCSVLDSCKQLGRNFQDGLNKLVADCRMQGPEHDALHVWLLPLMEGNKNLLISTSPEEAKEKLEGIRKQLERYTEFFE